MHITLLVQFFIFYFFLGGGGCICAISCQADPPVPHERWQVTGMVNRLDVKQAE